MARDRSFLPRRPDVLTRPADPETLVNSLPLRRCLAFAAAAGVAIALLAAAPAAATDDEPLVVDGLTEATAAASCWEIVQRDPDAESGVYWIVTPELGAPERFYCDQESDGGGWVLIGRGRQGWSVSSLGTGTPVQVRGVIDGPDAFTPRQLSSDIVDGLVNGQAINELTDGIRLVRATTADGSTRQDVRFRFANTHTGWTWQFESEERVTGISIDGTSISGTATVRDFGS